MEKSVNNRKVTKKDFEKVLDTMVRYSRQSGYIAFVGDQLLFFDAEPSRGGALITRKEVEENIKNW